MKKLLANVPVLLAILSLLVLAHACGGGGGDGRTIVYISNDSDQHIGIYDLDTSSGDLTFIERVDTPTGRPHELILNPEGTRLYASLFEPGQVAGFDIDQAEGTLTAIPGSPWAASDYSATGSFNPAGSYFYVPNYNAGNLTGYSVDQATGALTALPDSPYLASSGPYGSLFHPNGYLYVALSGSENIAAYLMSPATGSLSAAPSASLALSGAPYNLVSDPANDYLYVTNNDASNVGAYAVSPSTGVLTELSGSPYATTDRPWTLAVDPLGRFLYTCGFSIQGFGINGDGTLNPLPGPAIAFSNGVNGFTIDPSGRFLISAVNDDLVRVHHIDQADGTLTAGINSPYAMSDPFYVISVELD